MVVVGDVLEVEDMVVACGVACWRFFFLDFWITGQFDRSLSSLSSY